MCRARSAKAWATFNRSARFCSSSALICGLRNEGGATGAEGGNLVLGLGIGLGAASGAGGATSRAGEGATDGLGDCKNERGERIDLRGERDFERVPFFTTCFFFGDCLTRRRFDLDLRGERRCEADRLARTGSGFGTANLARFCWGSTLALVNLVR